MISEEGGNKSKNESNKKISNEINNNNQELFEDSIIDSNNNNQRSYNTEKLNQNFNKNLNITEHKTKEYEINFDENYDNNIDISKIENKYKRKNENSYFKGNNSDFRDTLEKKSQNTNGNNNDIPGQLGIISDPPKRKNFKLPKELKKTFIVSLVLFFVGIILIIIGFISAIARATPGGGIMFWVIGGMIIIPGAYYLYQFFKAKNAKTNWRRQDILDNIPQL